MKDTIKQIAHYLKRRARRSLKRLTRRYPKQCAIAGMSLAAVFVCGVVVTNTMQGGEAVEASAGQEIHEEIVASKFDAPSGVAGVLEGLMNTDISKEPVERIGTSCEEVIVGQRTREVEYVQPMDMGKTMRATVDNLTYTAKEKSINPTLMSDTDYQTLLAIVEAEAGGEDLKGKILVANVIMNRVADDRFPNTVTEVVWEREGGAAQFSPTADGRIGTVEVSEESVEAVKAALEGTDYSEGALFFVAKEQALASNVDWFESDLKPLFKHGVHEFYTYPED